MGSRGGLEGKHQSSVVTRVSLRTRQKVKSTRSILKVCCTVHEGYKRPKRGVSNVASTQDSQEKALEVWGF
eukprot:254607-Prorocentrum_minimum.AAC.1